MSIYVTGLRSIQKGLDDELLGSRQGRGNQLYPAGQDPMILTGRRLMPAESGIVTRQQEV